MPASARSRTCRARCSIRSSASSPALVAYRGTAPALNDLVGGQIDYMVDQSLNVIPQIKGGTIKVYAIAAPGASRKPARRADHQGSRRRLHLQRLERDGGAQGHAEGHRRQARRRARTRRSTILPRSSATSSSAARPRRAPIADRRACRSWSRARWRASRPVLKAAAAAEADPAERCELGASGRMRLDGRRTRHAGGRARARPPVGDPHQIAVGDFFDAPDFVPVGQAHIMADTESLGEAGVALARGAGGAARSRSAGCASPPSPIRAGSTSTATSA